MRPTRLVWFVALCLSVAPVRADEKLAAEARGVLERYCGRCHGTTRQSGDLDVLNFKGLLGQGLRVLPEEEKAVCFIQLGEEAG